MYFNFAALRLGVQNKYRAQWPMHPVLQVKGCIPTNPEGIEY
jgi:hypothetical protein